MSTFLLFLFLSEVSPDGARRPSARPVRQVPAPAHGPPVGLRFPPGDHPRSDLVDDARALGREEPLAMAPGLPADAAPVRDLTAGHDPLGGQHERDWDHRFLVREAQPDRGAEYAWPPPEEFPEGGCAPDAVEALVLQPGAVLDRFGDPAGRVLAEGGTPFAGRSLPPEYAAHGYHCYRVERPLPVWRTVSAAWFGQPGGGVRYRATHPVVELLAMGYLTAEETAP